jgi:ABC-type Fe3+ transport system permease subunit
VSRTGQVSVPQVAGSVLGSVQSVTSALLLIITYFGFILAGRSRMSRLMANLSSSSDGKRSIKAAADYITADIETYVWVQTVTGLMIAAVSAAVMFAVGLDNAWFWTILLFLLCFIPMAGEFVIPDLLGGSETLMLGKVIWTEFFSNRDWPAASAVAIVLLATLAVPILLFEREQAKVLS